MATTSLFLLLLRLHSSFGLMHTLPSRRAAMGTDGLWTAVFDFVPLDERPSKLRLSELR